MARTKRIALLLAAAVGLALLALGPAAPLLAQSPTPGESAPTTLNYRLIFILIGTLVLATGILAGVIIYMLKRFKDRY